ncbi:solute carrier family 52, riboflavin transporter, member 3-A [Octopus sinensis]|uniref:Riboflavin transporter n=1 Tax=Octopus sinensis TaxID=2607531 RepID=A0A6P7SAN1_9MOLL|nr:solute carrier family 52, riboflavin transporter, member 3-A [Octopus sinensis]XP_029635087.1 solute carrier family 52, riboflavin transporter, member 3-A [Octopus sinensis]
MKFTCEKNSVIVHSLLCVFGIGSWIAINGIWVELPILVQNLPEKWDLPSYLSVVIQLANIGPITYTLISVFLPNILNEKKVILTLLIIGSSACMLLSFFWDKVTLIAGRQHSSALLILEFFLALVDCTSSVAFFPFVANFQEKYLISYFIGEGLSGLLPSFVALGQGAKNVECMNISITDVENITTYKLYPQLMPPHFPVRDFFLFLFTMMLLSGISFTLLNTLSICKNEMVINEKTFIRKDTTMTPSQSQQTTTVELNDRDAFVSPCDCSEVGASGESVDHLYRGSNDRSENSDDGNNDLVYGRTRHISLSLFIYLIFLTTLLNALSNGVLPAIQSYACLPYGNYPYFLSVLLNIMANPVTCFVAFFLPSTNVIAFSITTLLGLIFASYELTLAVLSPNPFFKNESSGPVILVISWCLVAIFITYSKLSIATIFRRQGRKGMYWYGAVSQAGSAVGSIIMFILVNVLHLFTSADACANN